MMFLPIFFQPINESHFMLRKYEGHHPISRRPNDQVGLHPAPSALKSLFNRHSRCQPVVNSGQHTFHGKNCLSPPSNPNGLKESANQSDSQPPPLRSFLSIEHEGGHCFFPVAMPPAGTYVPPGVI